uniref:Uncharacterized protein n=1 Tax=Aegilops tauschii subsp. strangulata TaxID=200361 RepID=A0A453L1B0_AEGTS
LIFTLIHGCHGSRVLLWKALVDVAICSASGLRRVSHQDIPLVSSIESANSLNVPFVLNDFADDGSNATSLVLISFFFFSFYFLLSSLFQIV